MTSPEKGRPCQFPPPVNLSSCVCFSLFLLTRFRLLFSSPLFFFPFCPTWTGVALNFQVIRGLEGKKNRRPPISLTKSRRKKNIDCYFSSQKKKYTLRKKNGCPFRSKVNYLITALFGGNKINGQRTKTKWRPSFTFVSTNTTRQQINSVKLGKTQ